MFIINTPYFFYGLHLGTCTWYLGMPGCQLCQLLVRGEEPGVRHHVDKLVQGVKEAGLGATGIVLQQHIGQGHLLGFDL